MAAVQLRRYFTKLIQEQMKKNRRIWVLCGDLGYGAWDEVRAEFPERFVNTGAAEQALVGMGVGLALQGMIPLVYSITPFLLYRPFETIRNYLHHEAIPVKLIGSGRNRDYGDEGFSHWAEEDKKVMALFPEIVAHWPDKNEELDTLVPALLADPRPWYINLRRG